MQANRDVALGLSRAIMEGDWAQVDALLDERFVYVSDARPPLDKAGYVAFMRGVLCKAMTDMDMRFTRVVAEGALVAVEYTNAMTHTGPFAGVPATGRRVVATGHFIREVQDGRITGEWQTTNALGLLAQLGALPGSAR